MIKFSPKAFVVSIFSSIINFFKCIILSILYVPFVWAVLLFSIKKKAAHDPRDPIDGKIFTFCLTLFISLCGLPFLFSFLVGMTEDVTKKLELTWTITSLILFFCLLWEVLTCNYAIMRSSADESKKKRIQKLSFRKGIRLANFLQVAFIIYDFLQLLVMVLSSESEWSDTVNFPILVLRLISSDFPFPNPTIRFNTMSSVTGIYSLLIGICIVADIDPSRPGASILYDFISGSLFIPITTSILKLMDCRVKNGVLRMVIDNDQECFSSSHAWIGPISLVILLFYMSSAIFMASYRAQVTPANVGSIGYLPHFRVMERALKGLLSILLVLFGSTLWLNCLFCVIVITIIAVLQYKMQPCVIQPINDLRLGLFMILGWACVARILSFFISPDIAILVFVVASVITSAIWLKICLNKKPLLVSRASQNFFYAKAFFGSNKNIGTFHETELAQGDFKTFSPENSVNFSAPSSDECHQSFNVGSNLPVLGNGTGVIVEERCFQRDDSLQKLDDEIIKNNSSQEVDIEKQEPIT